MYQDKAGKTRGRDNKNSGQDIKQGEVHELTVGTSAGRVQTQVTGPGTDQGTVQTGKDRTYQK